MVSITKKVAWNSFWIFCGKAIAKLIEFIAFAYLARVLTASGFGLYSFAQALLAYLLLMVDGGLSILGVKEVAKGKGDEARVISNLYFLRFILALIILVVSGLVLLWVNVSVTMKLFLLATFSLVLPRAINPEWAFQGLERMGIMSLSRVMEQLIYIGLILVFIHNLNDLLAVPLFQLISGAAVALIFAFVLWKLFVPFGWRDLRRDSWGKYLIAAVPLGLSFVFIQVYYNLDVIMLGFMKSHETVGWYNAAYKLFFVLLGSMGVVAAAVFPVVIRKFEADKMAAKRFLEKYLRLMFLWTWPAVLLGWLWAEPAIRFIYGSSYLPGVLALKILLLNILVIAVSGVYGTLVLLPTERNKEFMLSVGLGALCNLVLNLLLIPPFSLAGAAVATLITEIVVALMFVYWAKSEIELAWQPHVIKPGIASGLACGATLLLFGWLRLNDLAFLTCSLVVFAGTYLLIISFMGERKFLWEFAQEVWRGAS